MATTTAPMTFAEFERLPDEPGKLELLRGELIRMPPAKLKHANITQRLFLLLFELVNRMRRQDPTCPLGEGYQETGYRLSRGPDSWLVPDVSVMYPDQRTNDYAEGAPIIAIEVVSESNTARQLDAKVQAYLAAGAREAWVLYPDTRSSWTYYAGRPAAELGTEAIRSELIPSAATDLRLDFILGG